MRPARVVASGHPGTESGGILTLAYREVLARTATLIVAALDGANPKLEAQQQASPLDTAGVARFAAKSLARAAARKLYGLCYNAPHWRVGWRHVDGPDVIDLRAHPRRRLARSARRSQPLLCRSVPDRA